MTKIDLVTGFLGAGKTCFLQRYARYLMDRGEKLCILENDFGAINVDMVLLHDLQEAGCDLEMVIGGDGAEAHRRRFKTKLIAMGMKGYDRVLIEPSGIFDMDEFFDVLYEEPLDAWYQVGSVITIVDAALEHELSEASEYLLASEAADAGKVVFSKSRMTNAEQQAATLQHLNLALERFHCTRRFRMEEVLCRDWDTLTDEDFEMLEGCGYRHAELVKALPNLEQAYETQFIYDLAQSGEETAKCCGQIFADPSCGHVFRIKGFVEYKSSGDWMEINATREKTEIRRSKAGQAVLILIGEGLNQEKIREYFQNAGSENNVENG